jgi:stage V sporulation protein G
VEITDVRIRLVAGKDEKLRAFACVALDGCFVVRDIKIISKPNGLFVAMPSRKLTFCCPRCNTKNHLRAKFCSTCGGRLPASNAATNGRGRAKLFADVAHPITQECRERFHRKILAAYEEELARSQQPGYTPQTLPDEADPGNLEYLDGVGGDECLGGVGSVPHGEGAE